MPDVLSSFITALGIENAPNEVVGGRQVVVEAFEGKHLNSPNDVVVKSDGSIWFTDPSYGILVDYEGQKSVPEMERCDVYRIDAQTGEIAVVADDFAKPNGIAFSRDESILYIADTGASHKADGNKHIRRFEVAANGQGSVHDLRLFRDGQLVGYVPRDRDFEASVGGVVGAAVTLGLDRAQFVNALGIAGSITVLLLTVWVEPASSRQVRDLVIRAASDLLSSAIQSGTFKQVEDGLFIQIAEKLPGRPSLAASLSMMHATRPTMSLTLQKPAR
ncbi:MAG: hypothetical protein HC779_00465 [Phyllobacteriaceae bacterium]|nr:hypothetical protein [Phyllobacteriaceae bacterium]